MESILFKIAAFLLAVGLLVAIHEFGHFWVARRLGVKVLRFSVGFGKALWQWRGKQDGTEYVIAAVPLGGYVKMLDEREGEVAAHELHRAFNRQSLPVRSAIVAAGPVFNFLFAILAFWLVLMLGETGLRPLVGEVEPGRAAALGGFQVGDEIQSVNGRKTPIWSLVVQELAANSMSSVDTRVAVIDSNGARQLRLLPVGAMGDIAEHDDLVKYLGLTPERPRVPPVFGKILDGEPALHAGVKNGDRILSADGKQLETWRDWVAYVQERPGETINLLVDREGVELELTLVPATRKVGDKVIGRIGASNQPVPGLFERYRVEYSLAPLAAFTGAVTRTWEYSALTLKVIGRILTGEASIHNLSGPITIADAAGKTASIGLVYFLKFLAIVSISLGVLNLLPVPVLDGGHLFYFALEAIKGSPLSEDFMLQGQKIGLALLLGLMMLAFYVDILRYLG